MKKIIFIQEEYRTQHGIMSLSAALKKNGFTTDVFIRDIERERLIEKVMESHADMACFTSTTPGFNFIKSIASALKKINPELQIGIGGAHPTFYPEVLSQNEEIDFICRGEGDDAIVEMAKMPFPIQDSKPIPNIWMKVGGEIISGAMRPLIHDLDSLPYPDREVYFSRYPDLASKDIKIMVGRGCPYDCSYCFNSSMKNLYKGNGLWTRLRTAASIIDEIHFLQAQYPIRWINFHDDTFNVNKKWLMEFLKVYSEKVRIPFICQLRIDNTDEELIKALKNAGVDKINVGIEHGDENLRRQILKRTISNSRIEEFGSWIRKYRIRLHTTNMMGFPNEDIEMAFSTISLNAKLKPELAVCSILNPYPGTEIYNLLKKEGFLTESFDFSKLTGQNTGSGGSINEISSFVKNDHIREIMNLRCFFMTLVRFPWLKPIIVKFLIKMPGNSFFEFIWRLTNYFRVEWKFAGWKERILLLRKLFLIN